MVKIDVLTYCSGYSFEVYDRFIGTLLDTGYGGTIYIVIQEKDIQTIRRIIEKYNKNVRIILDNLVQTTHINCHRFFVYNKFLETNIITSDYVLLCDSRDVLFQRNIETYSLDLTNDIYCFAEDVKIKNETFCTTHWLLEIEELLSEKFMDSIKENMVICAGTTLLKVNTLKDYINLMCEILIKYNIKNNLDQGIHNYLIYRNKLKNTKVKILENKDNLVNTVGFGSKKIKNGKIVNDLDEISYIVHQYDRMTKEMLLELDKKYNFITN
jgi:hypothetical protein